MSKSSLLKNARNYAEYLRKKERGPVKAFFHITKNENVPAIEQQGLLTNHPNANINSANHPFRKHGTDAGGVWVTTEPTAFPVYGTTIGGKNGNAEARADALSTIKIEVPLPELAKMKAVQDPYGRNILRKGDDPRAIEKFGTWAGIDVPSTVFLDDIKPQWLKNIGYVEENAPSYRLIDTDYYPLDMEGSWRLDEGNPLRGLDKSRLRDYSGLTGHHHNNPQDAAKSPYRFVDEYVEKNQPISKRLPEFPVAAHPNRLGELQGADIENNATNASKRFGNQPLAFDWTNEYRDYVKPGESIENRRRFEFAPGAIARGMGGAHMPSIKERKFDWNRYKKLLAEGDTPQAATFAAQPNVKLDWDNIVRDNGTYQPQTISAHDFNAINEGAISRGMPYDMELSARNAKVARRKAAAEILRWRNMTDNAQIVKNYGVPMTDDELRELDRLEAKITPKGVSHLPGAATWSKLENPEILRTRQRALDKIKDSWLYDYLLGKK